MRWIAPWILGVVAAGVVFPPCVSAQAQLPPLDEWQFKGILAGLKDEYPRVNIRAAQCLLIFLRPISEDGASNPERKSLSGKQTQEVAPYLNKMLTHDDWGGMVAAEALGLLQCGEASLALRELLLQNSNDYVRVAAAEALGLLGDVSAAPTLREKLNDTNDQVREAAAEALRQLGDSSAASALRDMLNNTKYQVRVTAANALGRLGDAANVPALHELLNDKEPSVRVAAAEALVRLGDASAAHALRDMLSDEDYCIEIAALALGRLGDVSAAPTLRALLFHKTHFVRVAAAEALRKLGDASAAPALRDLLKDGDFKIRSAAADALGRLGDASAGPALRELLSDEDFDVRISAAEALDRLGDASAAPTLRKLLNTNSLSVMDHVVFAFEHQQSQPSLLPFLDLPYEDTSTLCDARWLAHYLGHGEEPAETLCAYLGRPKSDPDLKSRADLRTDLERLGQAWDDEWDASDPQKGRWLREDAAGWASLIINMRARDWRPSDKQVLEDWRKRLEKDEANKRGLAYIPGIDVILAPFYDPFPPWLRSCIAVVVVNLLAGLVYVLRPARGGLEKWLPFLGYAVTGLGAWFADLLTQKLNFDLWLLILLLVGEVILLLAAGVISPKVLRRLARIEPLNRIAVPLALRLSYSRHGIFRIYVKGVRNQLERDRRLANKERYFEAPADKRTNKAPEATLQADPASGALKFLTLSRAPRGHVLFEAPGGRGKSALLREVVRRALEQFVKDPLRSPLPVLLSGGGDDSIEERVRTQLGSVLLSPEILHTHLAAGHFLLVLDGASEAGVSVKVLSDFIQGPYGAHTPLLLSSRPTPAYRRIIEGTGRWMILEPCRLEEATVGEFVKHYGGQQLTGPLKAACRGRDQTYLPILVRMAMTLSGDGAVNPSVVDVYRGHFLRLFEAQLPDEAERIRLLEEASRWCLTTYWREGERRCAYDATELQQSLRQAGVLIPADGQTPPREVQFFHDSMQSYLTAYGLTLLDADRDGYDRLPYPKDDSGGGSWDRSRVLLWAAANRKFTKARADILPTGGTELFQMVLAAFTPRGELRSWLHVELKKWAAEHDEDLRRKDVLASIPPQVLDIAKVTRGAGKLLAKAADACLDADDRQDSLDMLGMLYARIAPFVYDLREPGERQETAAVAA